MVLGSLGYVVNDGLIRRATEAGLDVYQALCLRSMGLAVLFGAAGSVRGDPVRLTQLRGPLLWRVGAEVIASALFFTAIVRIEFANAQAILQIVPFAITLAAAVFLSERVSGRQYVTILAGFVGVLIVVRPATDGFSAWSLLILLSTAFLVVREFATRNVDTAVPASSIAMATAAALAVVTGGISAFTGWQALTGESVAMVALAMAMLAAGYWFTIETVRIGDLSVSAPFRYSLLVGAVVVGYLFFDEVPDALTIIGIVVIMLSGLYAIRLTGVSEN